MAEVNSEVPSDLIRCTLMKDATVKSINQTCGMRIAVNAVSQALAGKGVDPSTIVSIYPLPLRARQYFGDITTSMFGQPALRIIDENMDHFVRECIPCTGRCNYAYGRSPVLRGKASPIIQRWGT